MVEYKIIFTKQAMKDKKNIKNAHLEDKAIHIIKILMINPFDEKYKYEKLRGNLEGLYSRRINFMHRIVYQVYEDDKIVKIIRMWTHYDGI